MATTIRGLTPTIARQALDTNNAERLDQLKIHAGLIIHADASAAVTTANASDLPTVIALANALKAAYNAHIASAVSATTGQGVHMAADATNPTAAADATDQDTANTLLTELKADYNAHRVLTSSHPVADSTNATAAADATDLATAITLANELKTDLNAHFAMAMSSQAIIVGPA